MKNTTKLFFVLILSFIVVVFSVINAQSIQVNFLLAQISLPLVVIIIGAVIIGALIVLIVMLGSVWKKNKIIKQQKQDLIELKSKSSEDISLETEETMQQLKTELKEKELELSDLKHQLVSQMMEKSSAEESNQILD